VPAVRPEPVVFGCSGRTMDPGPYADPGASRSPVRPRKALNELSRWTSTVLPSASVTVTS
jgi:hypothetical protein